MNMRNFSIIQKYILLPLAGLLVAAIMVAASTSRANDLIAREYIATPYECVVQDPATITPRQSMHAYCNEGTAHTTQPLVTQSSDMLASTSLIPETIQCTDVLPFMERTTLMGGETIAVEPPAQFLDASLVSTNQHVAIVSGGRLIALTPGTTHIYAVRNFEQNQQACRTRALLVTVNPTPSISNQTQIYQSLPQSISSVATTPPPATPSASCPDTLPNMVTTTFRAGESGTVELPAGWTTGTFVSSNTNVARINDNNTLTATNAGSTYVYAQNGSCRSRTLTIAVNPL